MSLPSSCPVAKSCMTLRVAMDGSRLRLSVLHHLPESAKFISTASVMSSNLLILVSGFSFCLPSFPASGSFPVSWLFTSDGKSIGVSASVLPVRIQGWFPLRLVWYLCWPRDSQESSPAPQFESISYSVLRLFMVQLSHPHMTTGKTIALTRWSFVGKVTSLLFNRQSRLIIAFLPRSKRLWISWLQSPSAVILETPKISHCFHCFPIYLPWSDGTGCCDLTFLNGKF